MSFVQPTGKADNNKLTNKTSTDGYCFTLWETNHVAQVITQGQCEFIYKYQTTSHGSLPGPHDVVTNEGGCVITQLKVDFNAAFAPENQHSGCEVLLVKSSLYTGL